MPIPKFDDFFLPVLQSLKDGHPRHLKEIRKRVAISLSLNEADLYDMITGESQKKLVNRVGWALSYLYQAELTQRPLKGVYCISPRGKQVLVEYPDKLDAAYVKGLQEVAVSQGEFHGSKHESPEEISTPEEVLEAAYQLFASTLEKDVVHRLLKAPPSLLEQTVVRLLIAMGYGGGDATKGQVTGQTGDGGIDGTIKEDALGLDVIYIQAKRFSRGNNVSVRVVKEFIGSLVAKGARKGVFVTTSDYTPAAREVAEKSLQNIVLIDGRELGRLMVRHNVGVRVRDPLEPSMKIKIVDDSFFDEL